MGVRAGGVGAGAGIPGDNNTGLGAGTTGVGTPGAGVVVGAGGRINGMGGIQSALPDAENNASATGKVSLDHR